MPVPAATTKTTGPGNEPEDRQLSLPGSSRRPTDSRTTGAEGCPRLRILVTGGAGFIGSALVRYLAERGDNVVILDDMSRGSPRRLQGVACEVISGDIRDPDSVNAAVHGCEAVVHAAFVQGTETFYREPRHVLDVAVRGMINILDACRHSGTADLLLISSSEVYQATDMIPTPETVQLSVPDVLNPRYSYGGGKILGELMAIAWQRAGILDRVIIARPHNITGPDMGTDHVVPQFALRMNELDLKYPEGAVPFPVQGTGQETRSFCFISDCTAQLALLLDEAPSAVSIWNVGTDDERTIADVASSVAAVYDREIKLLPGALRIGSALRRTPDIARIRTLGAPDPLPFETVISRTASWYRQHG